MVKQTKVYEVEDLKAKAEGSKSFFLIGYKGWSANLFNQLRRETGQKGGQLKVIRNNLFDRAVEGIVDGKEPITGPMACLFSLTDEIAPLSILCQRLKENGLEPDLKLGFLTESGQSLNSREALKLANLPGVEVIKSMLVNRLAANFVRLLVALNTPINNFVLVVKELSNKQGGDKQ